MWRDLLRKMVKYYAADPAPDDDPMFLFSARPPSAGRWPDSLPLCPAMREFYQLCDGGEMCVSFVPFGGLVETTTRWIDNLKGYDDRGDILFPGRHIVFAEDAGGAPHIWDSETGKTASFYYRGGDWEEPSFRSFEAYLQYAFSPSSQDEEWSTAIKFWGNLPD